MKSDAFDKIPEYDLRNKQDPYENEIGYSPKLEGDDPDYYGFRKLSGKETLYDVGFTLIGVQGGRYHGAVTEINENEISKFDKIGVMAGASTPKEHINEVKEFLKNKVILQIIMKFEKG